jgi:CHAT domain
MAANAPSIAGLVYLAAANGIHVALVEGRSAGWTKRCEVRDVLGPIAELRDELADIGAVSVRRLPRLTRFAQGWGRLLIPAAVLAKPPDVLLIVPHALLHGVPLHLVQADNGRALACNSGISYASSPTFLLRMAVRNPVRHGTRPDRRSASGGGTDVLSTGEDMLRSLAMEVLGEFGAQLDPFDLSFFSRIEVRGSLRNPAHQVACVISHGYIDPNEHNRSGLLIGMEPGATGISERHQLIDGMDFATLDGPRADPVGVGLTRPADLLTVGEMERDEPAQAELAVLLACSAGASEITGGDEPASMAEAMLRLGCASVIAPMWDCDYALARAWIRPFISAWNQRGMPKALAAREAFQSLGNGTDVTALGPIHLRGDWL